VGALDYLLAEIVIALQLTEEQIARMESAYRALAAWLEHPDSPLAVYRPLIYPQGSVAIGTTVRPRLRVEFDLDFVLEVAFFPGTPMELYELLLKRLEAHGTYAKMIEPKRRCIRVRYEGDFHADILGSRTAPRITVPGSIEVPDRKTPTVWKDSNPRGFAAWFTGRSRSAAEARFMAKTLPLPSNWEADAKTVLQRIVQLAKRQRDMVFGDQDSAPRSIVLTTLEATVYRGQLSVYEAMVDALDAIAALIEQARPGRIVVPNPMNQAEDFSEKWDENPGAYAAFTNWLLAFRERVHALRYIEGLEHLTQALAVLFGEGVSRQAMQRYQKALAAARAANQLRAVGPAIITGTPAGRVIPPNRNYGADD
jgi:hypothetical protein